MQLKNFIVPDCILPDNVKIAMSVKANLNNAIVLPKTVARLRQVHGNSVLRAPIASAEEADGLITTNTDLALSIRTADCLPLAFWHNSGLEVGIVHAGWRGLAAGIITNALNMLQYNVRDYSFWLGPCISQSNFIVKQDVVDVFLSLGWKNNLVQQAFLPKNEKFLCNLSLLASNVLTTAQVPSSQIFCSSLCTYAMPDMFYSYRREPLTADRMQSFIWITA